MKKMESQNNGTKSDHQYDEEESNLYNFDDDDDDDDDDATDYGDPHGYPPPAHAVMLGDDDATDRRRQRSTRRRRYRGFSTSLCALFRDPTDCLAFVCCGVLQSDRSYFLLTDGRPPPHSSFPRRLFVHVLVPGFFLYVALRCENIVTNLHLIAKENNHQENNDAALVPYMLGRLSLLSYVVYVVTDLYTIVRWRNKVRHLILARAARRDRGDDRPDDADDDDDDPPSPPPHEEGDADAALRVQHRHHVRQAHQICCGCYQRDDRDEPTTSSDDENFEAVPVADEEGCGDVVVEEREDFCTKTWTILAGLCGGALCGCWLQCFGVCAIAQEAREVKRLVSQEDQMIDYITCEPYSVYYPKTLSLRTNMETSFLKHFQALSQLSKGLFKFWGWCLLFFFVYAFFSVKRGNMIEQWLVLLATFFQAFSFLYLVYWTSNRFTISLDAVVKYFAAGFVLSISITWLFETLVEYVINAITNFMILATAEEDEFNAEEFEDVDDAVNNAAQQLKYQLDTLEWQKDHLFLLVLINFLQAFMIAAVVEEMCKYFSFYMVDHPDFKNAASVLSSRPRNYNNGNNTNTGSTRTTAGVAVASVEHVPTTVSATRNNADAEMSTAYDGTLEHLGTKITIAMVSVALGFACNENITYVMGATKGGIASELTVLIHRAILPVHPLCAAIQSIGICQRDIEGDTSCTLRRILGPSICLHGIFDFLVMVIPVLCVMPYFDDYKTFIMMSYEYTEGRAVEPVMEPGLQRALNDANSYSMTAGIAVGFLGFCYYLVMSSRQKQRLIAMDRVSAASVSRLL